MAYWPGAIAVLNVHVPALVTRLPALPAIRSVPSGDSPGGGGGGEAEGGGGGGGELGNGLDEGVQPDPFHSYQDEMGRESNREPGWVTASSGVGVAPT